MAPVQRTKLAIQLNDVRGKTVGRMEPDELIKGAIAKWGEGDLFYRDKVPGLARCLNADDEDLVMCVFQQPGTDHYFALPENRSVLLNRLGITGSGNGGYTSHIKATLIQALDEEGFEYLGSHAPELSRMGGEEVGVTTKSFTINKARLGKILKTINYIGFELSAGGWCLVPQTNIVHGEVNFKGVIANV